MSSYYDDPDFAEEYRRRDDEAEAWAAEEREREDLARARTSPPDPLATYRQHLPVDCWCGGSRV